jgi:hypothetical protein
MRAAFSAASFTILAKSAPLNPGVPRASTFRLVSSETGTFFHTAVETAGPKQRRVQHVGAVGSRDKNHAVVGLKAVHLDKELIERLLALVMPAAQASTTVAANSVDFVDEDNARSVLFALLEQVTHAAGAHANKHLHEI